MFGLGIFKGFSIGIEENNYEVKLNSNVFVLAKLFKNSLYKKNYLSNIFVISDSLESLQLKAQEFLKRQLLLPQFRIYLCIL